MFSAGGAAVGGVYGAFSDDTSVLGGALGGAMLGAGAWGAAKIGGRGMQVYSKMGGMGATRGQAIGAAFDDLGRTSKRFLGARLGANKPVNPVASPTKATKSAADVRGTPASQLRSRVAAQDEQFAIRTGGSRRAFQEQQLRYAKLQQEGIYASSLSPAPPEPPTFMNKMRRRMGRGGY
jgi:hypothetical protein